MLGSVYSYGKKIDLQVLLVVFRLLHQKDMYFHHGLFWGILDIRCRIAMGPEKSTLILTTCAKSRNVWGLGCGISGLGLKVWGPLSPTP